MSDDLRVSGIHWSTYNECALCLPYRMSWGASRHPHNHLTLLSKRLCAAENPHIVGFGAWLLDGPEATTVTNFNWSIEWALRKPVVLLTSALLA